jgi:hypothetical protein
MSRARTVSTILIAGLIAGTLDITAAFIFYAQLGRNSVRLLQGIASGVLGKAAFDGGLATALFGLLCHYFIATTWAALYTLASYRLPFLIERPIVSGTLYALIVYAIMNHVVVPLSAIGPRPFVWSTAIEAAVILVFCIGIPISLTVRHFSNSRTLVGG